MANYRTLVYSLSIYYIIGVNPGFKTTLYQIASPSQLKNVALKERLQEVNWLITTKPHTLSGK